MGWNDDTVKKFYNISLEWPGIGPLDLQPGWNYTFTVRYFISFIILSTTYKNLSHLRHQLPYNQCTK